MNMNAKRATIHQWEALFEVAQNLKNIQPWLYMQSDDIVSVRLEKAPAEVFCSVMGGFGACYGISVFEGMTGLHDLYRIRDMDRNLQSPLFVMRDLTCLTLYWGDRDEVPSDQRAAMKELGLRYRGSGNWPYAVSFERRYGQESPDAKKMEILIESLQHIYMVARAFAENRIHPQWDGRVMLVRTCCADDRLWHMGWSDMPEVSWEYPEVRLKDDLMKERLKRCPQTKAEIFMDLIYLDGTIKGADGGRDIAPLVCIVADRSGGIVRDLAFLAPEDREIDAVVSAFTDYILKNGKMALLCARNPWVLAALKDTCAYCGIPLVRAALPEMDELAEELSHALTAH